MRIDCSENRINNIYLNNLIYYSMIIEFKIQAETVRVVTMSKLRSGCSCWNAAYFI